MKRTKSTKIKPMQIVAAFATSGETIQRLDRKLNPLSYRLAVNRYNKGRNPETLTLPIMLVRRTDEQTGEYFLMRI